ncbi:phosphatidylserine/phosphatidylglycerophosphate/cardiolipin synthase family protein [Dongia soli]|uniref:Phospholipase D n=1 Tax=Dongia soli TaxID=600628 RepID=A0ABU5E949_9PROT|nr:phospholipase D-like domain-containing protein [Dongia soli]MDY0882555.1 phospholipase D-like domain-containing protein [Dongia soli]
MLQRHLAIEEAISDNPLTTGNRTHLLRDGPQSFRAIFAAIRAARTHINLEYYILEDVESDGTHLSDLLLQKRREGVAVNVIYDSFGSLSLSKDFLDRLRKGGIQTVEFNPVNPLDAKDDYSPNDRDHRKILIVDGKLAIIGGVNLSRTYESVTFGRKARGGSPEHWRDTNIQIEGPAVAQIQDLFVRHWAEQKGPPLDQTSFYPTLRAQGSEVVRIIGSSPSQQLSHYYVTLLSAIRNAEKSIWLTAAYFVPTEEAMEDITAAAKRGVDVRLLLPDTSDAPSAVAIAHSHYTELLDAGVKIYETQGVVLHSKTVIVDGVWSAIGSSNFDQRSVLFNDEIDAIVLGRETAQSLSAMFSQDIVGAKQIDAASWKDRPVTQKIKELFAQPWEQLL